MMRHRLRGVSLLEALVSMAVMAIGAVAVVGLQSTLRLNGDVAKQRTEAVRLAQQVIEDWRGFTGFDAAVGAVDWADIASVGATTIVGVNATFTREVTVVERGATDDEPLSKTVHVRVTWVDRANEPQSVVLNSVISGTHPELGGSLSVPFDAAAGSPLRNPGGRHPAIPRTAVDQGNGTSSFAPPGGGDVRWIFSNTTGLITRLCSSGDSCSDVRAMLLSGFVRFATGSTQPTPAQAESPPSATLPIAVTVVQESPTSGTIACFEEFATGSVAYYCLMPVTVSVARWTGKTRIAGINVVSSINDDDDDKFKVCRYTTVRSNSAVVPTNLKNTDHPLRYLDVDQSLTDQNYLVIRAGDDSNPFVCPNDDPGTANVNTATWYHQPES